ncbi:uncharacterized protein LOC114882932 isoform X2 [Osmia bicornis bicornis]|uniref:uncharacterized protein LOC114882932 isoform X2 n=1 Tax=Osmia bicornis bicornis TaxID=1437191 RepID=UPI001EAE93F1|nr:uncharacterized protein LOC114882932 isoform X2 [Osmia bicornis bicornis]
MFAQRQSYFYRLTRSYPILKLVDIYDRQSFIRAYVLDNVYVCILMHILFYLALWFATTVIKKMEKSNKEMLKIMGENRTKLQDVTALKDKKSEYDEVVVKVYKLCGKSGEISAGDVADRKAKLAENIEGRTGSLENLKILEPSFPPPLPPEPPPRKYGIFVTRPPGQRRAPTVAPATAPTKLGFK